MKDFSILQADYRHLLPVQATHRELPAIDPTLQLKLVVGEHLDIARRSEADGSELLLVDSSAESY